MGTFDVKAPFLDPKVSTIGSSHGLLFGIILPSPIIERVTGTALNGKGKHHSYWDGSIFLGQLGAPWNESGVKIRGDVLVENFTLTHDESVS
jgi:hypothetical protein